MFHQWQDRISIDPDIHHGDTCIRGTRVPVTMIVASLADGMSKSEILENYPQLTEADILAALAYAAEIMRQESLLPIC